MCWWWFRSIWVWVCTLLLLLQESCQSIRYFCLDSKCLVVWVNGRYIDPQVTRARQAFHLDFLMSVTRLEAKVRSTSRSREEGGILSICLDSGVLDKSVTVIQVPSNFLVERVLWLPVFSFFAFPISAMDNRISSLGKAELCSSLLPAYLHTSYIV